MEAHGFTNGPARPASRFPGSGRAEFGQGSVSSLSMKWSALHDAADTIAMIAGHAGGAMTPEARGFPGAMREAPDLLRESTEQGVADLTAILEPGLAALLAAHARGANPAAAAGALWREFLTARDAVMALMPHKADTKPRHSV